MPHWKNKVVVVTGGSDGLGLEIARAFCANGATVVILARHEDRLMSAAKDLKSNGANIDWVVADVTNDESVNQSVQTIVERHQQIDVWVNNVGKSTRSAFLDCDVEFYKDLMEINFYSVVRASLAVIPHLKKTGGSLINIGSLSCKTGWPNVAPYTTSKHAMAGFHHQLRLEGPDNINYLLVCPGPIQRTDSETRYADQGNQIPDSARQPGGGVKLKGIAPKRVAEKIESYCRRRKTELIMPWYTRFLFVISQLSPKLGDSILRRSKKK